MTTTTLHIETRNDDGVVSETLEVPPALTKLLRSFLLPPREARDETTLFRDLMSKLELLHRLVPPESGAEAALTEVVTLLTDFIVARSQDTELDALIEKSLSANPEELAQELDALDHARLRRIEKQLFEGGAK